MGKSKKAKNELDWEEHRQRLMDALDNQEAKFIVKDSGKRQAYDSGMVRDVQDDKPAFQYLMPEFLPYEEQILTRWADHMRKGADKYGPRNWEKADSEEEYSRFKASAFRHFMQWFCDDRTEDHAVAVFFNISAAEAVAWKIDSDYTS